MEFLAALFEGLGSASGPKRRNAQDRELPKRPRSNAERVDFWVIMALMTFILGVILIVIIAGAL